jgi:hypothetical protein
VLLQSAHQFRCFVGGDSAGDSDRYLHRSILREFGSSDGSCPLSHCEQIQEMANFGISGAATSGLRTGDSGLM